MSVYLKLETSVAVVKGDVVDPPNMEEQILVNSVSWDYKRDVHSDGGMVRSTGGGARSNGVQVSCAVGTHTPLIFRALAESDHQVTAEFKYDDSDEGNDPHMIIMLGKATVARMSINNDSMSFSLLFRNMTIEAPRTGAAHVDELHELTR